MRLTAEQEDIVSKNHNLIYWFINFRHLDPNEWYDLLAIELCYTVIKYNPEKGSLSNYFRIRSENLLKKEYLKTQLKKNKGLAPLLYNDEIFSEGYDDIGDMDIKNLFNGDFGSILKMKAEGYTQSEIAEKYGVTQSYISKIIEKKRKEYYGIDG